MSRSIPSLLVIGVAAAVAVGCAGPAPAPIVAPSAAPLPAPSAAPLPAPSAAPLPAPSAVPGPVPSAGAERAVPVYYVAQTAAGPRLQREFHRVAGDDPPSAAVREMLAAPTGSDPDYRNPWPAGTALRAPVTRAGGTITVELSNPAPSDLAAQQVVFTVQGALGSSDPVRLNGTVVRRGDPYALRNLVQIDAPIEGATSASPLVVTGEAAVFEAVLHWEVLRGGTGIRTGVAGTAEGQVFAPFRFTLDLPAGTYTVKISEDDPSAGAGRPVTSDDRTVTIR
jgi:Immunoglobulin-like domain of bacterial spore germination/Sporulation and spore germination